MTSKLPEGWKEVKLVEVADYINSKISIEKCNVDNYISTTNMIANKGGIILAENLPKAKSLNFFKEEDILVSNIRPYFRKIWFAEFNGTSSTDILIFRAKKHVYSKFLYYVLSNNYFFDYSTKSAKGTKMPRGDKKAIMNYLVPKITLIEQNEIADTLSALDDKIELNNKINENLEEQAQTIFKHWFINFEFPDKNGNPYKSSGGEMIESELGMIPKGWEVGKVKDYAEVKSGYAFKSSWWKDKGVKVLKITNISTGKLILDNCSYVDEEKIPKETRYIAYPSDLLIALTGATLGKMAIIPKLEETLLVNQRVGKFIYNEDFEYPLPFLYCLLNTANIMEEIIDRGQGSAQPNISPTSLGNIKFVHPLNDTISKFNNNLKPFFKQYIYSYNQSRRLSQLRDTLLPKLMSGEIRIPLD